MVSVFHMYKHIHLLLNWNNMSANMYYIYNFCHIYVHKNKASGL